MKQVPRLFLTVFSLLFFHHTSLCQYVDSLDLLIGSIFTYSTQDYQPQWIVSNRWGTIADRQADLSTNVSFRHKHYWYSPKDTTMVNTHPNFSIDYGVALYNNQHFSNTFLEQAYVKVAYRGFELAGGRFEEAIGELNHNLSSGSLAQSRNALPFPQITIATSGFMNVPFTFKWLQFKGRLTHGWLGENRIVENSYVHGKTILFRVGRNRWFIHGGLHHFAVWGGYHTVRETQLPDRFKNLLYVFAFQSGNDLNKEGNHLGVYDFGITINADRWNITLYNQTPLEDDSGNYPLFNPDRLLGISWSNRISNSILSGITFEYISTVHQSGDKPDPGRDNYYNNGQYRTGWNYKDRIIGTPLFFNTTRAIFYLPTPILSSERWNVMNSRVKGFHMGIDGTLTSNLRYRTLITYTDNYGNFYNNEQFTPSIRQFYSLQEFNLQIENYLIRAGVGVDLGGLGNTIGGIFGLTYSFDW